MQYWKFLIHLWLVTTTTSDGKTFKQNLKKTTTITTNETIHSYFMWCQIYLMKSTIKNVLSMSQILITQKKCNLHSIAQRKSIHHFNCLWDTRFRWTFLSLLTFYTWYFFLSFSLIGRNRISRWKMSLLNNLLHSQIFPQFMFWHSSPWLKNQ